MKDLQYILKNIGIGLAVVSLAFIIDLAGYYRVDFMNSARRLFTGDIYSLTYYGVLVLFVIVLWELWNTLNDAMEEKQRFIAFWICFILVIIGYFLPVFGLFKLIGIFFLVAVMLHIAYQQYLLKKK
ncbi:hypothetical protein [Beduini massiliensis]|uniref:hypothetical protein n=1 Tax=Beduini massiliensis TaxID=1585974 RepID=UPI00059A7E17|nr:hypothetical protein [Beduini massiliensis]